MTDRSRIAGTARALPLARARLPFERFVRSYVSGSRLLLIATLVAVAWANSPWADLYERLWETELAIETGGHGVTESLRHWVNNGLMALFFFVVGLEIKREVLVGELRSIRNAILPIVAAIGGMVVPATIYVIVNLGGAGIDGWGIPMATDIAFALAVLFALGNRVPLALRIFLTALAIVDDIGAILVIALFYTEAVSLVALGGAAALLIALAVANRAGVHWTPIYAILGIGVWYLVLESGVHATVAGVLVALTVPARAWIDVGEFLDRVRGRLQEFENACFGARSVLSNERQQSAIAEIEAACTEAETSMQHLQHELTGWVTFGVLPLFALANADVSLGGGVTDVLSDQVTLGIIAGLVLGKPIGITLFTWLAVRFRLATLPAGVTWTHIFGVGWLGGIGFTMSLFIADLAFTSPSRLEVAKIGIFTASLLAAAGGWLILAVLAPRVSDTGDTAEDGQPSRLTPPLDAEDHRLGPSSAPATLTVFADYECPYSREAVPLVQELETRFGDRLCVVHRHYPLTESHPHAADAAEAAEAAAAQGKFWEMHDLLFAQQDALTRDDLVRYATDLDLDLARCHHDLGTAGPSNRVRRDTHSAEQSGVAGTPTFFVNGRRYEGRHDFDDLAAALDSGAAGARQSEN